LKRLNVTVAISLLSIALLACGGLSQAAEAQPAEPTLKPTLTPVPPTPTSIFGSQSDSAENPLVEEEGVESAEQEVLPEEGEPDGSSTPTPTLLPPISDESLPDDHYWFTRPISNDDQDYLDRTYPYGGTSGGRLRPHTGGDFANPEGIIVESAGTGTVFFAGNDDATQFGPQTGFYGSLVVIEHSPTYKGSPIFTLYGHLSEVLVEQGESVGEGTDIGKVGGTGVAAGGAHLHFEVRTGPDPYDYVNSTRNPDLWLKPYVGFGTLAGRVVDTNGALLPNVSLTVKSDRSTRYTWTYAGSENNPDDEWGENFTYGDLPEGWYTITTRSDKRLFEEQVYIHAGETAWLELVFE